MKKKTLRILYSRFDRIPKCDGQTVKQTDIVRQHSPRYAYASRGNKLECVAENAKTGTNRTIILLRPSVCVRSQ